MAVAGKVAITLSTENGGAWSAGVTYDRLVAVTHNNNLYISRKTVTNVEPPNDEYWFLALEGFGGDDVESILQAIENIINGTTQVGNAKTLDGHGAEYFASAEELDGAMKRYSYLKGTVTNDDELNAILQTLHDETNNSSHYQNIINVNYSSPFGGGYKWVEGFKQSTAYGWQKITYWTGTSPNEFWRNLYNGTWSNWYKVVKSDDLANYLPLTGGRIDGGYTSLTLNNASTGNGSALQFSALGTPFGFLGFAGVDNPVYIPSSGSNSKTLLHTGNMANYVLPLTSTTAKTIAVQADTVLRVKNTGSGDYTWFQFFKGDTSLGYFGFSKNKEPLVSIDSTPRTLLHTGNKPTGTYTGNGSATARTVDVGGLANGVIVTYGESFALVTSTGAILKIGTSVTALPKSEAYFDVSNRKLVLATANTILNGNGYSLPYCTF